MERKCIGFFVLLTVLLYSSWAHATDRWWKIAPATCSINTSDSDPSQLGPQADGSLRMSSSLSGNITAVAYCPVFLPDGVSLELLRVRTFQSGGIPTYTNINTYLKRMAWTGSLSSYTTAYLMAGDTYDDVALSGTVDNEDYQYYIRIYFYHGTSATSVPSLGMIEIRYDDATARSVASTSTTETTASATDAQAKTSTTKASVKAPAGKVATTNGQVSPKEPSESVCHFDTFNSTCKIGCPSGYVRDTKGCPVCKCYQPDKESIEGNCKTLTCPSNCDETGYVEVKGCATCTCGPAL